MRRPIKMDAGLRRRPKTNALFAPKTDAPSGLRTRDAPAPGCDSTLRIANPYFLPASQKGRRHSRRPSSCADFHLRQPGKAPVGHAEAPAGRTRAAPYSPCAPFTAPSISRAWASDASVASPESMRAISAGRSSADSSSQAGLGHPVVAGYLGDRIVHIAVHGNLGQARHHDDLMAASQVGQDLGQRHGHGAAYAGIHLVEHQRVHAIGLAEHHLYGQHDAADLAARGYAGKRAGLHAGAGLEHELHLRRARAGPRRTRQRALLAHELRRAHLQSLHLRRHRLGEPWRSRAARTVEGSAPQLPMTRSAASTARCATRSRSSASSTNDTRSAASSRAASTSAMRGPYARMSPCKAAMRVLSAAPAPRGRTPPHRDSPGPCAQHPPAHSPPRAGSPQACRAQGS